MVSWHNADSEDAIDNVRREISRGHWRFTSSPIDVSRDIWTLNLAVPHGATPPMHSLLVELFEPAEPMISSQVLGTYVRPIPPAFVELKERYELDLSQFNE